MGRKEYYKKRAFYPGKEMPHGVHGAYRRGLHQPGMYGTCRKSQGMAGRHYASVKTRAGIRMRMDYKNRNHPYTVGRAKRYGVSPRERRGTYENSPYAGAETGTGPGASHKEKEIRALKEKMHIGGPGGAPGREALPTGGFPKKDAGGMAAAASPKILEAKTARKAGMQDTAVKTGFQGVQGMDAGSGGADGGREGESQTEELKRKLHARSPEETGSYWKMYAAGRIGRKSVRKSRADAKAKGKEAYIKRRKKEIRKRKMGHYRSSSNIRGYSQYVKAYRKEAKRQRKEGYRARKDEAKAQMKQAFLKSASLHFSKAIGSLSGTYEEDAARQNPMAFLSAFVSGAIKYAGKRAAGFLVYVLGGVLSALMPFFLLLLPFLLILCLLVSLFTSTVSTPELYFNGGFAGEAKLKTDKEFIDNAIQEHFDALANEIENFANSNPDNVVVYQGGYRYNKNSVLAVYFSILCTRSSYNKLYQKKNKEYPPYLLVDTDEERSLLKEIFGQMNYYKETQVSQLVVTGVDPETNEPITETKTYTKLTVYNLTISQWLSGHPSTLTKKARELLDVLKKYETVSYGGGSSYTPLGDITMPDGVDENLVYMAATLKAEAVGEPEEGQIAVGFVIWNRAGGSMSGVKGACLAPGQFTCWDNGSAQGYLLGYSGMSIEQLNADACYRVCVAVTTGQTSNPIGTKRYYCNPGSYSGGYDARMAQIRAHNSPDQIQVIGNHVFCENGWW